MFVSRIRKRRKVLVYDGTGLVIFMKRLEVLPQSSVGRAMKYMIDHWAGLESCLDCGILSRGFVRGACESCRHEHLVALSCEGRGFCPACGGRQMTAAAAHLVDNVFPTRAPVRQWVLSLPIRLRYLLAYDKALCA